MTTDNEREFTIPPAIPNGGINRTEGYVYLIRVKGSTACKIGASYDIQQRMKKLQTNKRYTLECIAARYSRDYMQLEMRLQCHFKPYHLSGDWFALPQEAIDEFNTVRL